ncbi:RagB/SusD family nutrient uptake outer membrane protein [Prolixibacteraceae bacterium Z1-6]|uniref:RagB/SusD family nutrient uptake outer membrane protein n=1 Tax=Draconibacterium aestuarii TaxID=2998507 RepID=A0A9X3F548_9BACT|nr:RagB/SusD family nutrient uptake outer membrane protein [Prolixibacteraceae bacterium Z1-6]
MKKIRNITGLVFIFLLAFNISCKDEFLQEAPLSTLSPENTFVDAAGLQTALDASIKGLFNQWNGDTRELMFNSSMSEATVMGATDKPDSPGADMRTYATPINSRDNDAGRMLSFYREGYYQIKNANTVIDYIDVPEWEDAENDTERNHLLGSAYFMRAFWYMQLTMEFGNVAFPLNVVTEAKQDFKAFHMQGIWDQMINDLEYAVQHMKKKSELPIGQPPVDAARILLAKYYMLNKKFAEAEALMTTVIDDPESRLFTADDVDVDYVMVGNNENPFTGETLDGFDCKQPADPINLLHQAANSQRAQNPEGIFSIVNKAFIDGNQGRSARVRAWGPNLYSTNKGVKAPPTGTVTGINIDQNSKSKQMHKWGRGQGFCRPTNYSQYEIWHFNGETDWQDYRHKRGNWFDMDMAIYDNKDLKGTEWYGTPVKLYHEGTLLCEDSIRCFYGYPFYKFFAPNEEDQVKRQDGGKADMYIYREAEAYLVRAEARFWQDKYQSAADDINVIRTRANSKYMYTASDVQEEGVGAILDERNRELYGEEYRHDELVRMSVIYAKTGKSYKGHSYSISGSDIEKSLSAGSFYYDRVTEKSNFFRDEVPWSTYPTTKYTMDPKHIFWPVYEPYLIGNVGAVLNQTTGYDGAEDNIEPLTHVVQPAGAPNVDPMEAIGDTGGE